MAYRVPTTILTGFLGSGKTTLLNYLLSQNHGFKIAVIVNEFGDVNIDSSSIPFGEQFVELDNGCLCCALNEDLEKTIRDLKSRGGFDYLLIETTGLADPIPVAWTFAREGLSNYYRIDAIITLIDSLNFHSIIKTETTARMQLERADIIVLNKIDLVSDVASYEADIRSINAIAPLITTSHAQVPWNAILTQDNPQNIHTIPQDISDRTHTHDFKSWSFPINTILKDRILEDFLYDLPLDIFRLKGIVQTDSEWKWTLINVVAGRIDMSPLKENYSHKSSLVFIGKNLNIPQLEKKCLDLIQS